MYSKSTGEHSCRSVISINLQSNFIEIALRHGCSPVNLLHIFRTRFRKNTSGRPLLLLAVSFILVIIYGVGLNSSVMKLIFCCLTTQSKETDSLEGSLDRVLFAVELAFPKILVPRLPQHTSNVNIEYAGKSEWSKQLNYLYGNSFLQH